jgi:DUF4097 and DUF4098 domain-containing protein YvlB
MRKLHQLSIVAIVAIVSVGHLFAQEEKMHNTFQGIRKVQVKTTSGDCEIRQGTSDEVVVDVAFNVRPENSFEPEMRERGGVLKIKERWLGSSSGRVIWTLTVPQETEVEFSTASGELLIEGLNSAIEASTASGDIEVIDSKGNFDFSTASGDISLQEVRGEIDLSTASGEIKANKIEGEIELSTASGDIDIRNSKGRFDLGCASGEIEARDIVLEDESSFSTASGEVEVQLAQTSKYDIELSSASGDVTLDYQGNEVKGYFEFTARKTRGRITSPFDFDKEEEYGRNEHIYVRKSFTKDDSEPKVYLETSSGRVTLKK